MGTMLHLSFSYLRYYKKQTAALLAAILLSAALLSGLGGLFESGRLATLEHARTEYGDWHCSLRADAPWFQEFDKDAAADGYHIRQAGLEIVRKAIEEPFSMQLVYADAAYLELTGRKVLKGMYPQKEREIAIDRQTLRNLGVSEELGTQVVLDGEAFTLCGIMGEMPSKLADRLGDFRQVFVSRTLDYGTNGSFLYLKFEESQEVYPQIRAFAQRFGLTGEEISTNRGISRYVGGDAPLEVWEILKTGFTQKGAGLPYIWGILNEEGELTQAAILLVAAFFGAFVLYSLFQVSVIRRMSQYSMMQTLGMTDRLQMGTLFCELGSIGALGYPLGCVLGNLIGWLVYQKAGRIFLLQKQVRHSGAEDAVQELAAANLPDAGTYHLSWHVMAEGAACLVFVLLALSILFTWRMKKQTIRQMMAADTRKRKKRKIYSTRHGNMADILTRKFMFSRKGAFLGILLSLSLGSVIFLGAFYVTENTRRNNELTFQADDGLGSEIEAYLQSNQMTDGIPEEAVAKMQKLPGIRQLHPVRYRMGEISFEDGTFTWPSYYAELAPEGDFQPDPQKMEQYNGLAVQTGEDSYALKVNIYGYDDAMLESLNDYLLEGEINPRQMQKENSVIVKTLMDGQGNYDGVRISPQDVVKLTTVKSSGAPQEALRFQGEDSWYQRHSLPVAALVSRPLAKVDTYIGDDGQSVIDIIMTNEQMERNFGVSSYQTISISLAPGTEAGAVSSELVQITKGVNRCVVKDYSQQIRQQNLYLAQQMFFYYGIAAALLGISLFHIMNSMQYLVAARKREFGILRAMGITDAGFCRMMAREGLLYDLCSGTAVAVLYFFVQKLLYYFMLHVYLYLHPEAFISWQPLAGIILLNIAVCTGVTLLSGRVVLREQVVEELKE